LPELNLTLLGPPGSGKGTQGERLQEDFRLPYYATGDILRAAVKEGTEVGKQAKEYMDRGDLVPDEVIIGVIAERLQREDASDGFILDGVPRTVPQAQTLDGLLAEWGWELDAVVELVVADEVVVQRLLGRGRSDDTEDVIRRRQQVYRDATAPLLDFYRDRLVAVDAVGGVEEIGGRILEALPSRLPKAAIGGADQ
jgi:adenylate kinase